MVVNWRGDEAIRRIRVGGARGLNRAARALLAESLPRVPVDTTDLRNSGTTHDATPSDLKSAVTYSATSEDGYPYGIRQHEDLTLNHPHGGEAKFLERPAKEMEQQLMAVVAVEISREVG